MLVNKGKSVIILKTDKNHDLLSWNESGQITAYSLSRFTQLTETSATKLSALVSCVKFSLSIAPATTAEFRSALTVSDIVVTLVKPSSDFESETLTSVTENPHRSES